MRRYQFMVLMALRRSMGDVTTLPVTLTAVAFDELARDVGSEPGATSAIRIPCCNGMIEVVRHGGPATEKQ